jgi:hypothetical protein
MIALSTGVRGILTLAGAEGHLWAQPNPPKVMTMGDDISRNK